MYLKKVNVFRNTRASVRRNPRLGCGPLRGPNEDPESNLERSDFCSEAELNPGPSTTKRSDKGLKGRSANRRNSRQS